MILRFMTQPSFSPLAILAQMLASRLVQRDPFSILFQPHSRQVPLKTQNNLLVLNFVLINAWDPQVDCKFINLNHHA
jgi:hypothetical protein